MSWPPSLSSNFIIDGDTSGTPTLKWGTDGVYGSVIVKSIRREPMAEEIPIENGTGNIAHIIQLVNGLEYELTCLWDSAVLNVSGLSIGATAVFYDPLEARNMNFLITKMPLNLARKEVAEFTLTAKYFTTANVPTGN